MNRLFTHLAAFTLGAAALVAAEPAANRTLQCRMLLLNGHVTEPWYVLQGKNEYKRVHVSSDFLGAAVPVTVGDKLRVYRRLAVARKDADGRSVDYEVLAEFPVVGARRQLILLAQSDGKWAGRAYPDEEQAFPNGSMLVFNFTKVPVAFDFGGTRLVLNPGEKGVLGAPKTVANDAAKIKAMRMTPQGPVTFFDSSWPWLPTRRNIVFAYDDPRSDAIFIKGIDDVREPEVKEKTGKPLRP